MDALTNIIFGKRYHIMDIKDFEYIMIMMTTYGKLDNLEGLYTHRRYKGSNREVLTKRFNYSEVFGNHFRYHHQFYNNKDCCNFTISVERTWSTKYWTDCCYAYFLALT